MDKKRDENSPWSICLRDHLVPTPSESCHLVRVFCPRPHTPERIPLLFQRKLLNCRLLHGGSIVRLYFLWHRLASSGLWCHFFAYPIPSFWAAVHMLFNPRPNVMPTPEMPSYRLNRLCHTSGQLTMRGSRLLRHGIGLRLRSNALCFHAAWKKRPPLSGSPPSGDRIYPTRLMGNDSAQRICPSFPLSW